MGSCRGVPLGACSTATSDAGNLAWKGFFHAYWGMSEMPSLPFRDLPALFGSRWRATHPSPRSGGGGVPGAGGGVGHHALRDLAHGEPQVHGGLLDPPEGVGLAEVELLLQDGL